jgi:hypothetical protein
MQARFANGLFDGRRCGWDSSPAFMATVSSTFTVGRYVEKPMRAAVFQDKSLKRLVLRETLAK